MKDQDYFCSVCVKLYNLSFCDWGVTSISHQRGGWRMLEEKGGVSIGYVVYGKQSVQGDYMLYQTRWASVLGYYGSAKWRSLGEG